MNAQKWLFWIAAWLLVSITVRLLGIKGFIGFLLGVIIATVSCTALFLKYSDRFFGMAEVFIKGLSKSEKDDRKLEEER